MGSSSTENILHSLSPRHITITSINVWIREIAPFLPPSLCRHIYSLCKINTCANAFFSASQNIQMPPFVRSWVLMARPSGKDVPGLSSHFCHVCHGDKQEGIFNIRHFLCQSGKAQGWWPSRHSANTICFPRRLRVFKWCRWGHFVCLILWDSSLLLLLLNLIRENFCFQANCPWHFERFDRPKIPTII